MPEINQSMVNIAGGVELEVTHRDGKTEKVLVRALPIKEFPKLLAAMGDEPAQVDVYCGQPAGWADTLTNESTVAVYELGQKINDDFFVSWGQRRIKEQERFVPGITKQLASALKQLNTGLTSGSQTSPSASA